MRVIQEQIKMLPSILGKQEIDGQKTYRPISFCILTDTDGQFIAYNSLTGEIVEVSGAEAEILKKETLSVCEDAKQLIEKWYLVPCEHDDIELANEILAFVKVF